MSVTLKADRTRLNHIRAQRTIAAVCVFLLSIIYLTAYVSWNRFIGSPGANIASTSLATLRPKMTPGRMQFAPDVIPPEVQGGLAPVIYNIPTKQPVVFLTIDDGVYREPEAVQKMREANVPASLFLTYSYVRSTPDYFSNLERATGSAIENHTLTHHDLALLSYEQQRHEICGTNDVYSRTYAKRPTLLRPPYGNFNIDTQRAAASCRLKAVVLWRALVQDGKMEYQIGNSLRPGDIVLMHFTPNFKQDLAAFAGAAKGAGLEPQLLEDWTSD